MPQYKVTITETYEHVYHDIAGETAEHAAEVAHELFERGTEADEQNAMGSDDSKTQVEELIEEDEE